MVVHEEQRPMCSSNNSSSGGGGRSGSTGGNRSSKKSKQKKPPQRGMGVAQLEELRLREQQKSAASHFSNPSSGFILPPAHHSSFPFADPSLLYRPPVDPNPLSRPSVPIPPNAVDFFGPNLPHSSENPSERGFLPMLWSAMESCPHDSEAMARKYNLLASLQSDSSNPSWRPPGLLQRRQQQQFSVVNHTLSPSSSGVYLQMEPPSNQSYSNNFHIPSACQEEDRMVGMKRPWPFNPESISGHISFPCKVPVFTSSLLKSDESSTGFGNGAIGFEPKSNGLREGTSSSGTNQVDWRSYKHQHDKSPNDNGVATDDGFLTLGPSSVPSISKSKQPFPPSHHHDHDEHPEFGSRPCQGSARPPFYSFFPMRPTSREALNERRGEALDGIDLNLRL